MTDLLLQPKLAAALPKEVALAIAAQGLDPSTLLKPVLIALSIPSPLAIMTVPGLPASAIPAILKAQQVASAISFRFVWIALAALVLSTAILACFTKSVAEQMTHHVESALETSDLRNEQIVERK